MPCPELDAFTDLSTGSGAVPGPNGAARRLAEQEPRGRYPRWLHGEQTAWTAIGHPDGCLPALFNEDGLIEVVRAGPVIEPLLVIQGQCLTWADCSIAPSLLQPPLPIPRSTWSTADLLLETTAFAQAAAGRAWLFIRYRLENRDLAPRRASLYTLIRPVQLAPPWPGDRDHGGVSRIRRIAWEQGGVRVNDRLALVPLSTPAGFGAMTGDEGPIVAAIAAGTLPETRTVEEDCGRASAALRFDLSVEPGGQREIWIAAPLDEHEDAHPRELTGAAGAIGAHLDAALTEWARRLGAVEMQLPEVARDYLWGCQGALAHILMHRDGPALQPGPRHQARAWMRDGAVMAAALRRFGLGDEADAFIGWYAGFQAPDGRVPGCVDRQGADWSPEHDSPGQFIFTVAESWRFGADRDRLEALWPAVCKAVAHLEPWGASTAPWPLSVNQDGDGVPADAARAYWDACWALRGLKDAVELAEALGDTERAGAFARRRDDFGAALYVALEHVMAERGRDVLTGAREWADADPGAAAMALTLIDELHRLPALVMQRLFDRFMQRFRARPADPEAWTGRRADVIRIAGALIRLGRREPAHELLRAQLAERRPAAWNQWSELDAPGHPGDLPQAAIGAEYCLVFRDLFVHEREADQSLVVAAGLPADWLAADAIRVHRLPTAYGRLDLDIARGDGGTRRMRIGGELRLPPGGLWVAPPLPGPLMSVEINGEPSRDFNAAAAHVTTLPAEIALLG